MSPRGSKDSPRPTTSAPWSARSTTARAPEFAFLELDLLKVKGKTEATRIFALLGDNALKQSQRLHRISPSVTPSFSPASAPRTGTRQNASLANASR